MIFPVLFDQIINSSLARYGKVYCASSISNTRKSFIYIPISCHNHHIANSNLPLDVTTAPVFRKQPRQVQTSPVERPQPNRAESVAARQADGADLPDHVSQEMTKLGPLIVDLHTAREYHRQLSAISCATFSVSQVWTQSRPPSWPQQLNHPWRRVTLHRCMRM